MFYDFYERYILSSSFLIPIIIAIFNYKALDKPLRTLFFFIVVSALLNVVTVVTAKFGIHNLIIFHIYAVFEFAVISWFYKVQFKGLANKIIPPLIIFFTILCVVNFVFFQHVAQFNTYTRSLEAVIIIGYCLIFFGRQSKTEYLHPWGDISLNWANASLLIYYSCSFFIFMSTNYLITLSRQINDIVWFAYDNILLLENILFAIAFYKCKKQLTTSLS